MKLELNKFFILIVTLIAALYFYLLKNFSVNIILNNNIMYLSVILSLLVSLYIFFIPLKITENVKLTYFFCYLLNIGILFGIMLLAQNVAANNIESKEITEEVKIIKIIDSRNHQKSGNCPITEWILDSEKNWLNICISEKDMSNFNENKDIKTTIVLKRNILGTIVESVEHTSLNNNKYWLVLFKK